MKKHHIQGAYVPLDVLLSCREERAAFQRELSEKYRLPMICLTLNITGPLKLFPLARMALEAGAEILKDDLEKAGLNTVFSAFEWRPSGGECYMVVDGDAQKIKKIAMEFENADECRRIFDADAIDTDGGKLSRDLFGFPPRKCIVCSNDAAVCGRSRAHGIDEVFKKTVSLMDKFVKCALAHKISQLAVNALICEVMTTPKPGLVDKNNSGAHSDMDLDLFLKSAQNLESYFYDMALKGTECEDPHFALRTLRTRGIEAERQMFSVTGGVNTHKGAIFSMGIAVFSAAYVMYDGGCVSKDELRETIKQVAACSVEDFEKLSSKSPETYGEYLFSEYGIKGVRGESADGFPSVFELALPCFEGCLNRGMSRNDCGVFTLLTLIRHVRDTNVLKRGGEYGLRWLRKNADEALKSGDFMKYAIELDTKAIEKNLSPGGCADLLALTYFIHDICENFKKDG